MIHLKSGATGFWFFFKSWKYCMALASASGIFEATEWVKIKFRNSLSLWVPSSFQPSCTEGKKFVKIQKISKIFLKIVKSPGYIWDSKYVLVSNLNLESVRFLEECLSIFVNVLKPWPKEHSPFLWVNRDTFLRVLSHLPIQPCNWWFLWIKQRIGSTLWIKK